MTEITTFFVSNYSYKRARQLLGKITTIFKAQKIDDEELPGVQSRLVRLIVTDAVDVKKCTRWRASALASSLSSLKMTGDFPLIAEEALQAMIAAVGECELPAQKEEVWTQLLDMVRKVGSPDYQGSSKSAPVPSSAPATAVIEAPAPPPAETERR